MSIIVAVLKEVAPNETRVALTPDACSRLKKKGFGVRIEQGAGQEAGFLDEAYDAAGVDICESASEALSGASIVACVQRPAVKLPDGVVAIGSFSPHSLKAGEGILANKASVLALELVPRTTRAQSMDVLSSQSNLAGYKAVIEAAATYKSAFPLFMTAAGTVPAAKVFVMGAGVAGLQAIATARRLGAVVSATDVRLAAKEQVLSLGAKFIMVEDEETKAAETSGGYAKEMSDAYKAKQAALVAETVKGQNVVITTALIPGRPAPKLLTAEMVASMKAGSVICDLAASMGGNCALTKPDQVVVTENGVTIIGHTNWPARIAADASALYARNMLALLDLIVPKDATAPVLNLDDDIIKAVTLTQNGTPVHASILNTIQP